MDQHFRIAGIFRVTNGAGDSVLLLWGVFGCLGADSNEFSRQVYYFADILSIRSLMQKAGGVCRRSRLLVVNPREEAPEFPFR
jgi:hypothetical protein